jgi:putative FmdB family regulatory protein
MPTYEYVCSACGNAWEEVQKITEPALEVCPACQKATAQRQISGGNFILKGGGWYADLYSSAKPPSKGGESSSGETKSSGDSKSGDSKAPETKKSETKSESASTASTAPAAPAPTKSAAE